MRVCLQFDEETLSVVLLVPGSWFRASIFHLASSGTTPRVASPATACLSSAKDALAAVLAPAPAMVSGTSRECLQAQMIRHLKGRHPHGCATAILHLQAHLLAHSSSEAPVADDGGVYAAATLAITVRRVSTRRGARAAAAC